MRADIAATSRSVGAGAPAGFSVLGCPVLLLLLALLLAACSGGSSATGAAPASPGLTAPADGLLTVRAFEWGFEPEAIALRRGEQVQIVLENEGLTLHDLKVGGLEADFIESRSTGPISGGEGQLFVGAEVGQRGTLVFVPRATGTFAFYCTIPGHLDLGMEGTLVVE